jgi:hypothetical protein
VISLCGLVALLMTTQGCDIFSTRTPEKPSEASSSFVPPTTPSIVIDNLVSAIRERNTENYIRCFVDSSFSQNRFVFQATQSAQTASGSLFRDWNLSSERSYFENVRSKVPEGAESTLLLTDGKFETIQADSAVYTATYTLVVQHTVQNIPQQAQGTLLFVLTLDRNNSWSIYRWIDNKTGNDFSWSDFKARFSS